jgi:hypothetical protein
LDPSQALHAAASATTGCPVKPSYEALTHAWIIMISLGQLYGNHLVQHLAIGCVLYFGTSFSAGVPDCDVNSVLAYYGYFIE